MQLYSRMSGQGDTALIILHGLLGSSSNWQTLAKRFGQTKTVYTLDMRNHGRSAWSEVMDYPAMAKDVHAFIDTLQHSSVNVLGHSMGGKAAMQLALDYPDSLDALIIADIAPASYQHDFDQLLKAMISLDLSSINNRAEADVELKKAIEEQSLELENSADWLDNIDSRIRAFLLHNLYFEKSNNQWAWRPNIKELLNNMANIAGFENEQNKSFPGPTLFVHGAESNYVRTEYGAKIKQYFPRAQMSEIKDAGHWLHAEQPQRFFETCESFLSHAN